ncbi:MAG TPA: hypothetical protein VKT49_14645 [Bryobacteraceae bacterium]|nr:hypothetical protein [Bryobacteraceae bacterium]
MNPADPLLAPMRSDEQHTVGGVQVDIARAGTVRVKRMIYPPGFSWDTHLRPVLGKEFCPHAHVGMMVKGQINVRFQDGCVQEFKAPQFVAVEPNHAGWVVGDEPAVLIEFDFEGDTVARLGLQDAHHHHQR